MFTINAYQQQQYTLVNKKYPDQILHLNTAHSVKKINRSTITAIPVFRSKESAEQFKKDIVHKKQIVEWYVTMDKNSKKSIMQAKTLSSNTYTDDIMIKEIDFNNDHLTHKLIMNNIAVMYINLFWYKHMRQQHIISGNLWLPNGYYYDDDGFLIDFAKLIYNKNNN